MQCTARSMKDEQGEFGKACTMNRGEEIVLIKKNFDVTSEDDNYITVDDDFEDFDKGLNILQELAESGANDYICIHVCYLPVYIYICIMFIYIFIIYVC